MWVGGSEIVSTKGDAVTSICRRGFEGVRVHMGARPLKSLLARSGLYYKQLYWHLLNFMVEASIQCQRDMQQLDQEICIISANERIIKEKRERAFKNS